MVKVRWKRGLYDADEGANCGNGPDLQGGQARLAEDEEREREEETVRHVHPAGGSGVSHFARLSREKSLC